VKRFQCGFVVADILFGKIMVRKILCQKSILTFGFCGTGRWHKMLEARAGATKIKTYLANIVVEPNELVLNYIATELMEC
jgi:hypothetical protein